MADQPKERMRVQGFTITQTLYDRIQRHAAENDLHMSQIVRQALREFFERQDGE